MYFALDNFLFCTHPHPPQCATLQHPFEARNQCALIMKIIETQVKIPATAVVSNELKNVILWLLQKDPNTRPSIKDVLNEVRCCSFLSCTQLAYRMRHTTLRCEADSISYSFL
jgi:serine/threonine protein kinase